MYEDRRFEYAFPDGGYIVGMRAGVGGDFDYYIVDKKGDISEQQQGVPGEIWDSIQRDPEAFALNSRLYIEMAEEQRRVRDIRAAYEQDHYYREMKKQQYQKEESARDRAAKKGQEKLGEEFAGLLNSMMKFRDS